MSANSHGEVKYRANSDLLVSSFSNTVLQRACGQHTIADGECAECNKMHLSLQRATRNSELEISNSNRVSPLCPMCNLSYESERIRATRRTETTKTEEL